jgi:hypothetical protein
MPLTAPQVIACNAALEKLADVKLMIEGMLTDGDFYTDKVAVGVELRAAINDICGTD